VLAALLGYWQKTPCSSGGAWNSFTGQFRDACYTDIYPLYYNEGLSVGEGALLRASRRVPVLIGAMMQAGAWLVHSVSDPYSRGRDFYYVTVVMLAVCLRPACSRPPPSPTGRATRGLAGWAGWAGGWAGRKAALLVALSPALILAAFVNWDLFAMAAGRLRPRPWAARRHYLPGAARPGVATKFYPLLLFGALLLVSCGPGRCASSARPSVPASPPGWWSTCQSRSGDGQLVPASTRSAGTEAPTGDRSGTCSSTTSPGAR